MNASHNAVAASYAYCRRMSRRAGSNFCAGFLLLPRDQRLAMQALYAFMRHTDDLADAVPTQPSAASTEQRRKALTAWRAAMKQALQVDSKAEGRWKRDPGGVLLEPRRQPGHFEPPRCFINNPSSLLPPPLPPALTLTLSQRERELLILPALADTVQRFQIPHEHLFAVIDGVEMDLDRRRYETFSDLERYCERVASAVGLACIHIWGFRGPEAFEPARQAGIALQLTNILRDLREDAAADRIYLPLADLRQCNYSENDLLAGVADRRFERLMAMEIARAEHFYTNAAELMDFLAPSGRRVFGLMMTTYRALLRQIARHPTEVLRRRLRPSRVKRTLLLARWLLLPPRKAAIR
jgi:15-cis-phytoene synthase